MREKIDYADAVIAAAIENEEKLDDWQRSFVYSMADKLHLMKKGKKPMYLSEKQLEQIKNIEELVLG